MQLPALVKGAIAGGVIVAAIGVGILNQANALASYEIGLLRDSVEASTDKTRTLKLANGVLARGSAAVQRRAVQAEQRGDSIDKALKLERKLKVDAFGSVARVTLGGAVTRVSVSSIGTNDRTPAPRSDTLATLAREASSIDSLHFRARPYTVAGAIFHRPPAPDSLELAIDLDTVPIGIRASCGAKNANGIRAAELTAITPDWFHVELSNVSQAPELCNPRPKSWRASWLSLEGLRDRLGVVAGVDAIGKPRLVAGVRLWP